jgi:hypothetical protein
MREVYTVLISRLFGRGFIEMGQAVLEEIVFSIINTQ